MLIPSSIGGHGGWGPLYEPYIGKVYVGTLRKDSFARPCEIICRRACIILFHHRQSVAILHALWRTPEVQLLGFSFLVQPRLGFALHDSATVFFSRASSAGRSA